jgi:ABC-type branched-subunit amino acid transport system permease subunit
VTGRAIVTRWSAPVGIGLLVIAPWVLSGWILFLLTVALAKALAVLGVVLLLRGGLVTFGHALYYAVGAYAAGFAIRFLALREGLALIALALVAGAAVSAVLGLLVARYRGVYFALLNLAFSMVLYGILLKFYSVTGGTDGIGLPTPALAGVVPPAAWLRTVIYYLALVLALGFVYGAHRFWASPLGFALRAIRDNEVRLEYMGVSVRATIYRAYVLAGVLASAAGVVVGIAVGHIVPEFAFWSQSGEFVFAALLGGTGSVVAPIVGSIVFEFIRSYAFGWSPYTWQMTLGIVLLGIIFLLPGGLWSLTRILLPPARARSGSRGPGPGDPRAGTRPEPVTEVPA